MHSFLESNHGAGFFILFLVLRTTLSDRYFTGEGTKAQKMEVICLIGQVGGRTGRWIHPFFPSDSKALLDPLHYRHTAQLMMCASVLGGCAVTREAQRSKCDVAWLPELSAVPHFRVLY